MDRRRFLQISSASVGLALQPLEAAWAAQPIASLPRGLVLYIDDRLQSKDLILERVQSAHATSPLLKALAAGNLSSFDGQITEPVDLRLALNHVLLIAKYDDALLQKAWQREAVISDDSMYAFGFGNFKGSLGYIESDRNPFLHAANIPKAPFECQLISITGTDVAGIEAAVNAFLTKDLVNGIVAKPGSWTRGPSTLLDRDPLSPSFSIPREMPLSLDTLSRIGLSQASEDEYRGVLADTGVEPLSIWRAKYYANGEWNGVGEVAAFRNYSVGLHRRAYGNTIWMGQFASEATATAAAPLIGRAAHLSLKGSRWSGSMPPYAWGDAALGDSPQTGTLELWSEGATVLMQSRTNPARVSPIVA